jgi:ribA/ribD-fused uncharacterized protein
MDPSMKDIPVGRGLGPVGRHTGITLDANCDNRLVGSCYGCEEAMNSDTGEVAYRPVHVFRIGSIVCRLCNNCLRVVVEKGTAALAEAEPEVIRFISQRAIYGWMSNFHEAPFAYDGAQWPTVEHAFQAAKAYPNYAEMARIRKASSPQEAKKLGRQAQLRPDWERVKVSIMGRIVARKFKDNPRLMEMLLATGNAPIEEDSPWDSFWGTGRDGNGRNEMGKILTRLRKELRDEQGG